MRMSTSFCRLSTAQPAVRMALSEQEKQWLEENREEIMENLNPKETIRRLRKISDVLDARDEDDVMLRHHTPRDQTGALLDLLRSRSREALKAFRPVVTSLHPQLASRLWPDGYCLLWLCPSAHHAAMAAHLLERFTNTKLLPPQDGPEFLVRRSLGGAFGYEDALLTLVFPLKPERFPDILSEALLEAANLVVMTGSCEALVAGLPVGQPVVPLSVGEGEAAIVCGAAQTVREQRMTLGTRLKDAVWRTELLKKLHKQNGYMNYCSAWLARLHYELATEQRSQWMERQRLSREDIGSCCQIPEWASGELSRHVLKERRSWRVNPDSPLGITPDPAITARISQKLHSFPSPVKDTLPTDHVLFNTLSTEAGDKEDISSQDAAAFYRACSTQLSADTEWLACLCLCHDPHSDSQELPAHTAISTAAEIVKIFMSRKRHIS